MNKLLACALLSFGLVQSVVACSDDDDNSPAGTAGSGAEGGTAQAGKGSGGASAGASSAGKANGGNSNGGSPQAGTGGVAQGGKAGGAQGGSSGSTSMGGDGAGGDEAVGGADDGAAGGGGEGGASDGPPKDPQLADDYWLNKYCDAKAKMSLGCDGSPDWASCYSELSHFLYNGGDAAGVCVGEPSGANQDEYPKTTAVFDAMDALAAACPLPMTASDWQCDLEGTPMPKNKACRDAEVARITAWKTCGL